MTRTYCATLRDGSTATLHSNRSCAAALALHEYHFDPETGTSSTIERLLSWHRTAADAQHYADLGGETYVVPVSEITA